MADYTVVTEPAAYVTCKNARIGVSATGTPTGNVVDYYLQWEGPGISLYTYPTGYHHIPGTKYVYIGLKYVGPALRSNSKYYYRGYVEYFATGEKFYGPWKSFVTTPITATTLEADIVTTNSARIKGAGDADYSGNFVTYYFQWKEGINGAINEKNTGYHHIPGEVTKVIYGLSSGKIHYFRVYLGVSNEPDPIYGDWKTFITQTESKVETHAATNIENLSATLNGVIAVGTNEDNFIERGFYWKEEGGNWTKEIVTLNGDLYSKVLTGLKHGTLHHFKAFGKCESGKIYYGEQLSFTTTSIIPTVTTQIATEIKALSVLGNGTIVDIGGGEPYCSKIGFEVRYNFSGTLKEYDAWKGHGFTGYVSFNPETGLWEGTLTKYYEESGEFLAEPFALTLDDLVCDKEFLYRAKAKNTAGWGYGSLLAFTTKELLLRKACTCGIFTIMLCAYVEPIPSGSVIKRRGFRWGRYNTAQEYDIHEDGNFSASATIGPVDTISFVCSNDDTVYDTIVDSSKGFKSAGFAAGQIIDVSATGSIDPANEGTFRIMSVSEDGGTIEVNVRNTLVSQSVTGVTIVELYALYIVDLDPETDYYSVAYVAIEDSEGNWTVQEGDVILTTTITNIFDFEGYDRIEFYKPEREQNYRKITRNIEAEIVAEQQYIDKVGGRRVLKIVNHLIQTKEDAITIGTNYKERFKNIKSLMTVEYPTPPPLQREDTLDIGFGRIRFKEDDKGVVNFMPDGEGLMLFRYRMVMLIRKIDMSQSITKENIDYMAHMELEEA